MALENLEPKRVWHYFEELSKIPRGSGNTDLVGDYCIKFAKERGLECEKDEWGNVFIRKPASKGYENCPGVILQGHLDMVCVKTPQKKIDFEKEAITVCTDGDIVWADGTSLGADDGIAVAYALAVLEDTKILHPTLEVLLTVDEEVGLTGAKCFDLSKLQGTRLLNIDSEEEGILTVSCAGGCRAISHLPVERERAVGTTFILKVSGLQGGHSGTEINQNRTNAILLLGRILNHLQKKAEFRLAGLEGGMKDNAIATEAWAVLVVKDKERTKEVFSYYKEVVQRELESTETNLELKLEEIEMAEEMFSAESTKKLIFLLYHIPNGVQKMSPQLEGLVQTSLNAGILREAGKEITLEDSLRSSVASEKQELKERLNSLIEFLGGRMEFRGEYPAWEYKEDSKIREIAIKAYERIYGSKPLVLAIHAGLECGIFAGKNEKLDCISFGPNLKNVHTVREIAEVASVERTWKYLLEILKSQC